MGTTDKLAYTVKEAAEQLSLCEATVYALIHTGRIDASLISRGTKPVYRVSRQALVDYLEATRYTPSEFTLRAVK